MDWNLVSIYSAPVISGIILFLIKKHYEDKPKLVASYIHASAVTINNPENQDSFNIGVHVLVLKNQGKLSAKNIRLGHNFLPKFNIYPSTSYSIKSLPDETNEILIDTIVPKEQLTITYVYDLKTTNAAKVNSYIKHDDGLAETIYNVLYIKPLSLWAKILVYSTLFIGSSCIIYFIIQLIAFFTYHF